MTAVDRPHQVLPDRVGGRDLSIDILRGLAIFIMLPANLSAATYAEPHPLWFRVFSSFAAPIFVFVAGAMVAFGAASGKYRWPKFVVRGLVLLVIGALIDVLIWRLVPFNSFDILYLMGIAAPLTYCFTQWERRWQLITVTSVFVATPMLQASLGYTDCPSDVYLWGADAGSPMAKVLHPTGTLQHLFIDGWFPLFPWLGMSFAGALVARELVLPGPARDHGGTRNYGLACLLIGVPGIHQLKRRWPSRPFLLRILVGG